MTAINQSLKIIFYSILVTWSSGVLASIQFFELKDPKQPIASPQIEQGGALLLRVKPSTNVRFNEQAIFIDEQGWGLIAVNRDATKAHLAWQGTDGQTQEQELKVVKRQYAIERINGLPPAKVTAPPDPKLQKRIKKEGRDVRQARTLTDARTDFLSGFIWPVKGRLSGHYGSQRILNGTPKTPHFGVDVAAPTGTPVVAPAGGKVIYANEDMYYSGGTLVIDHGHGLSSTFLHLSELLVGRGDEVKQGQAVAKVGATGRATGPHLDWRMNWGPSTRIDPELVVAPMK